MLGGYNVVGAGTTASTTISALPEHGYLHISFTLFIGDSWDNHLFYLYVDDEQVKS